MDTKERILKAAHELFAQFGLEGASVRDICAKAQANIAAINYYYGSKEALYAQVVRLVYQEVEKIGEMPTLSAAPEDPEGQLAKWIDWYVRRQLSPKTDDLACFLRREIARPSAMLQELVDQAVAPLNVELFALIEALLPPGTSKDLIRLHCSQATGTTIVKMLCGPVSERLGLPSMEELDLEMLIGHTQQCVMAGLHASGANVSERWLAHT